MIRVFYFFKFQFQFDIDEVISVWIQCNRCNKIISCQYSKTVMIDILTGFIKYVVFHHVGLSRMIEIKGQYKFAVDEHYIEWCTGGPRFNKKKNKNQHGPIFEELFVTAHKYSYDLMCGYNAHDKK